MSSIYHPGGVREIPGLNPGWFSAFIRDTSGITALEWPVAEGETLPFTALLALSGSGTCEITVAAPSNSNGCFTISGLNGGNYSVQPYSADDFGTATGPWDSEIASTLASFHPVKVEGLVGAGAPGMLRITVSGATVNPGSLLEGYPLHDGREYGVLA